MVKIPDFYTDEYFEKSQKSLAPLGEGILRGNIPDYYKGIGESGSEEFERMLGLTKRDIATSVGEMGARRRMNKGAIAKSVADATATASIKGRYTDLMSSIEGKKFLFQQGRGITEGVRGAGLEYGGQRNQYGLSAAKLKLQQEEIEAQKKASKDAMWGKMIAAALGTAGTIGGAMIGGPFGAKAGGMIGSAVGNQVSGVAPHMQEGANAIKGMFDVNDIFG